MPSTARESKERYGPLRFYSGIAYGFGLLIIGLGVIAAIVGIVLTVISDNSLGVDRPVLVLFSVGLLVLMGLAGLRLLAFSDLIIVFIDIEINTRRAASRLLDILESADDEGEERIR